MDAPPKAIPAPRRTLTYALVTVVLLVLGGHLLATLVYLGPPNVAKEHLGPAADAYMKPVFYQNWHLFSPNPGISTRKLAVRCGAADEPWTEWIDPLEGVVAEHYDNRFSGLGKLLYVYRAVGDDLRRTMKTRMIRCQKRVLGEAVSDDDIDPDSLVDLDEVHETCSPEALMETLTQTEEFALAVTYSQRVCEQYLEGEADQLDRLQFKLLEFFPVKYADREDADASGRLWGKVHEVVFPEVQGE